MPKVLVLADHIASQIAAGEVVERPSSVVKELVENSLDSGASQIEISIGADCRDIRIADNGCGMEAEDAVLAFHRHATSKLRSVEDLWNLSSLGFRGEALPSVSSVARVTCYTRTHDAATGTRIDAADGKVTCIETGCAPGTVMEITDLFYNVPARLNFLKRASTEFGHIHEIVQSLAIAYPNVAFTLLNQGNQVFRTSGAGDLASTIKEAGLFTGKETLCEVFSQDSTSGFSVKGFVSSPLHFRGDRKGILSIVNARPVRCPLTYKALDYAFSDLIPRGRHPLAVIVVTVDPTQLDVNIHPTKKEIKYSSGNDIYISIQRAIMSSLRQAHREAAEERAALEAEQQEAEQHARSSIAQSTIYSDEQMQSFAVHESEYNSQPAASMSFSPAGEGVTTSVPTRQLGFRDRLSYAPVSEMATVAAQIDQLANESILRRAELLDVPMTSSMPGVTFGPAEIPHHNVQTPRLPAGWRIAGYVHNTYIIVETPTGMMIVEQHIAHERTLYERILASQETAGRISENNQHLLISESLALSPEQRAVLELNTAVLQKLGFEFEMTTEEVTCSQVPLELAHKDYAGIIQEMVQQLAIADGANLELEATKSIACQSAIKNGMPMSERDLIKLLADWNETPRNDTCPHGRPVRLNFTMTELFQMFHPA